MHCTPASRSTRSSPSCTSPRAKARRSATSQLRRGSPSRPPRGACAPTGRPTATGRPCRPSDSLRPTSLSGTAAATRFFCRKRAEPSATSWTASRARPAYCVRQGVGCRGPQMLTRPPSLRAVAAFEAAARFESFSKAAEELNLTHSAISHAIRSLEQRLGAQLFLRIGRRVSLTHEGANLVKRVRASLALLTDAMDRRPQLGRSRLSIGADAGVALRLIAPRLRAFKALHPEIDIDLRSVASTAALRGSEIDLAVRSAPGADLGLSSRLIAHERLWPVSAPGIAQATSLQEASNSSLIESLEHHWSLWFSHGARKQPIGAPALVVDTDLLAMEVAKSGLGVCLAPAILAKKDLESGALVRLCDEGVRASSFYHLDWSPMSTKGHEIELFIAWLRQAISADTSPARDETPLPPLQVYAA